MTRPTTTGKAQDLIAFTRSTTGTYLDSVIYGDELVTNGDFSNGTAGWSSGNLSTLTVVNEALVVTGVGGAYPSAKQVISIESGKKYILAGQLARTSGTILARAEINQPAWLAMFDTNSTTLVDFAVEFTAVSNSLDLRFTLMSGVVSSSNSLTVDNVSVKEVIGGQGTQGTSLLRTSAIDEARIEYDASGNCLGLLVEEARTNLLPQSIANANWGKIGVSITENFATAPDESSTAYKISETTTNSIHYAQQTNIQFTSGITYTESLIAKAGTNSVVQLLGTSGIFGSLAWANFDLSDGTIGSKGAEANAAIKPLGNGWYRCSLTMTATVNGSASAGFIILAPNKTYPRAPSYQGNSDNHIYAWGIQTETGSFPTSYIPTSGSIVTRAADVASLAVSEFGYNQDQGSVVVEFDHNDLNDESTQYLLSSTSSSRFIYNNANSQNWQAFDGQSALPFGNVLGNGLPVKLGLGMGSSESSSINNGVLQNTTNATPQDNVGSLLYFGLRYNGANSLNGHIKSIQYYPLRLSNAQLQALTV